MQQRAHNHHHHQPHRALPHGLPRSPPTLSSVPRCACVWVSEVAGHERHCGPRDKPPLPEHRPAETSPLELRPFEFRGGFPRTMAIGGSMNSRGPPDHLPTGIPRTSSTTLRVQRLHQPPDDPRQQPRLVLRHCGTYSHNYVERFGHRNPANTNAKNSTPSSQTPLFGTTPRTPRRAARRHPASLTPLVGCSLPPPRPTGAVHLEALLPHQLSDNTGH